ncbi:glycoside hydrolase family 16 protein [Phanerochaete carnosa HHB-10118-sp]|uniref:Glycoside hydrolase family 16 protein n=1 Tax=Phanerochaete carnosa (strain HHB-10118-sp) TaxID=650164 RepID=K5VUP7_PHACS|nr:glycoside hydrolase family 16 protein [Phanerochaete carnosa HHB-10118-sp]EKM50284.1 glycoside hydrolase family 16 protein [Phanerochaete carnosa HHB-10118-sp]
MHLLYVAHALLLLLILGTANSVDAVVVNTRRPSSSCRTFQSSFASSDISQYGDAPFRIVSPESSVSTSSEGLQLYLEKPKGTVHTNDGTNNIVAEGATVNSTFTMLYGKVTFEVSAPAVPGVVTAAIMISDNADHDEIDVELLGGDPSHWQSNIFMTSPHDQEPLWGVFGEIEDYVEQGRVDETRRYTVDWDADRIVWSVDGVDMRTLHRCRCLVTSRMGCSHNFIADTIINGTQHYPSHAARVQLGIWDASNPAGTSEWAQGPINWNSAPHKMSATFKSLTIECPY